MGYNCSGLFVINGPKGMYDLGRNIMYKSQYAIKVLSEVKGVKVF